MRVPTTALHQLAEVSCTTLNDFHSKVLDTEIQVQHRSQRAQQPWMPPPPANLVKINFDNAVFSKENISGIGVVVRDENGLVLGSCSKRLPQAYSAMEVEAMAAATALVFANDI